MDAANSCCARLLGVPCRARAHVSARARAHVCLEPYRTHACQCLDLACLCVPPCLEPRHSHAHTHVAPDCSRTFSRVLSATSRHSPSIDASVGKAPCVLHDPPCASALICISVVIATSCRDTDTHVPHACIHTFDRASACARAHARACPHVRARTSRRYMACPLDAAHTLYVPVAAAPCHNALGFGPRTRVP
ncbi:hypothetical protein SLEP1_g9798 [Rubroshorea leprosula]|uniref:Uncharacterized protein n=1 Tax=Rubroshorea leprosula TaxID=152421 RepID=A0AAV5IDZ5_9ROSI|nr:hypothetical protein SLEP1_g9798 [Rubroshorea leprosula]